MNQKNKLLFLLFYLYIFISITYGQKAISFKNCLEISLEKNLSLQIVKNYERIADKESNYAFGYFIPTIDTKGTWIFSVMDSRIQRFSGEVQEKNGAKSNTLNSSINLNWNLFDGFAMFVNRNRLNETLKLGQLNTRQTIENLIASVGTEYFNYYQQQQRLITLSHILELSRERLRISEEKYKIGAISKLDYQQDRIEFNADSSTYLRQVEAIENARLNLLNAMAMPADSSIAISDSINVDYNLAFNELRNQTLASNTSILIANQIQVLSELDLKMINSRMYPTIYLTSGYVFNRSESQTGLTLESKQNGLNYGAGISFPLLSRFETQRQRSTAKILIENDELTRKQVELNIITDLTVFYNAYTNNIKVLTLEKQNLQTAYNNYIIAQERFKLGNLSGIEMREIQRMYLDAEDRHLNALYQAKLAEISLKQISGRIQEYL